MSRNLMMASVLALSALLTTSASASTTSHADRTSFLASVGANTTDDYSHPGYADNTGFGMALLDSDTMNAAFGQTRYQPTGFQNLNIVVDGIYCSGCGGSFLLDFTHTAKAYGSAQGVFGVSLDLIWNNNLFYAFVTYGDNSTSNIDLAGRSFLGLTSTVGIKSIHFGLSGGVDFAYEDPGYEFGIDNLTIAAAPVPEPQTYALMLAGLAGMVAVARRRKMP